MSITLALAKAQCRVETDRDDALIQHYLDAATAWVESYTGKLLTRRTVTQEESGFGTHLTLFWGPAPADLTVTYQDSDNVEQTYGTASIVRSYAYPANVWPSTYENTPVTLEYTAGYETPPSDLVHAVLLLVSEYYDNRDAGTASTAVAAAVESLCRPYRSVGV